MALPVAHFLTGKAWAQGGIFSLQREGIGVQGLNSIRVALDELSDLAEPHRPYPEGEDNGFMPGCCGQPGAPTVSSI